MVVYPQVRLFLRVPRLREREGGGKERKKEREKGGEREREKQGNQEAAIYMMCRPETPTHVQKISFESHERRPARGGVQNVRAGQGKRPR